MATFYVSSDGTGDGTSSSVPMSWATLCGGDHMTKGGTTLAGNNYYIKAGPYTPGATNTWTSDGLPTDPISIIGCDSNWNPITPVRNSGNLLLNTNTTDESCPYINYAGNWNLSASASSYVIYKALRISSAHTSGDYGVISTGAHCVLYGCSLSGTANDSDSNALILSEDSLVLNCDLSCNGTSSGSTVLTSAECRIIGCYITASKSYGIEVRSYANVILNNVIYGCTNYGIYLSSASTTRTMTLVGNTIYGGYGIGTENAAYEYLHVMIGNMVIGCTGYAFNGNTTGHPGVFAYNRTRDNSLGPISWTGTWDTATTWSHVTVHGTDAAEFVDSTATPKNLNLQSTSPAKGASFLPYLDIGALQRQEGTLVLIAPGRTT